MDDFALDRLGDRAGLRDVLGREPDVDRRRLAFVHRRADHAAGIEGELQVAETRDRLEAGAELVDVFLGRVLALVLELDLDDRVHRAGVGGVGGRQVGDHAQLGDDESAGPRRPCSRTNCSTWAIHLLGLLDPRAAGGPGVDLEGAGVDLGEELAAQARAQADERRRQQADGRQNHDQAVVHRAVELADVPADAGLDQGLPAGESAAEQAAAGRPGVLVGGLDA